MKKSIALACILTMTATLLTACGQSGDSKADTANPEGAAQDVVETQAGGERDRKSTRLNSSHIH